MPCPPRLAANPDPAAPVLIIDADRDFCEAIASYLTKFGYSVNVAHTGAAGLNRALTQPCQAVILDIVLPGDNRFDLLKRIRRTSAVPVLMVADQANEANEVAGLESGADAYLTKSCSMRQLLARLHAINRRGAAAPDAHLQEDATSNEMIFSELCILPESRRVTLHGHTLALTASEYEILILLVRAKGRVKTRDHLPAEIRDREYEVFDRAIDVQVSGLRRKLGDDPKTPGSFAPSAPSATCSWIRLPPPRP